MAGYSVSQTSQTFQHHDTHRKRVHTKITNPEGTGDQHNTYDHSVTTAHQMGTHDVDCP